MYLKPNQNAEAVGVEPTLTTIALGASVYHLHVAGIARPAAGVR